MGNDHKDNDKINSDQIVESSSTYAASNMSSLLLLLDTGHLAIDIRKFKHDAHQKHDPHIKKCICM
jgi:hypothetical protein